MGVRTLVVDHLEGDRLKELMSFCQEQYFEVMVVRTSLQWSKPHLSWTGSTTFRDAVAAI